MSERTDREAAIAQRLAMASASHRGRWWEHDADEIDYYLNALLTPTEGEAFMHWVANASDDIDYLLAEVRRLRLMI